jgi:hypothetical protein
MALNSEKLLSNITLQVNGVVVPYVPNTLTSVNGRGERKIMTLTGGGASLKHVFSEDITTRMGKISFQVVSTAFDIQNVNAWQDNGFRNVVVLSDAETGYSLTMQKATIVNDPEFSYSADGVISVEFQGTPLR